MTKTNSSMLADAKQKCAFAYTVTAWGFERSEIAFRVDSASQAYELVLNKAVHASLQVRVTDVMGQEIGLEDLRLLAYAERSSS